VNWPGELSDQPLTPRDVFGNKLERLDGLRMQDKVYITLLPVSLDGQWQLEILGYDSIDVDTAKEHLSTMIESVRAESLGVQEALNIILDEREGMDVELHRDDQWWPNHVDWIVPHLLPSAMMDEPGSFRQEGLHFKQLSSLQRAIKLALDKVRHKKGTYDFVVRLGCLALSSKDVRDDKVGMTFPKDSFLKQINGPIGMDVKKW